MPGQAHDKEIRRLKAQLSAAERQAEAAEDALKTAKVRSTTELAVCLHLILLVIASTTCNASP